MTTTMFDAKKIGLVKLSEARSTQLEIFCPDCERSIRFDDEPPRFCQNCGRSLSDQTTRVNPAPSADVTIAPQETAENPVDQTIAPTTPVIQPGIAEGAGDTLGPYQLVKLLGSGGMGTVWEAIETTTGRRVAIKRLNKSMCVDEKYVQRFVREAQLCAKISHPKVTFIYGSGEEGGQPYIAMELMPGKTLADLVEQEGQLEIGYAINSILDAIEGLIAAHELGLVHRDVKPSNCFLDTDESVKIGDFGLSKSLFGGDVNLTQTGTFMGTPSYAAPEQIRGGELDQRTDVYAVGATLFNLLAGRAPFLGDAMTVTAQIVTDEAPPVTRFRPEVPRGLEGIVAKCIAKDPAKRFENLEDLRLALLPFVSNRGNVFSDIGRRLAAFMIDQTVIQFVYFVSVLFYAMIRTMMMSIGKSPEEVQASIRNDVEPMMITFACVLFSISLLYFAIFEGLFGQALGKRLIGLRTVNAEGQVPGFFRALLRAFVIPVCFGLSFAYQIYVARYVGIPETPLDHLVNFICSIGSGTFLSLLFLSTMRSSNGLVGLHGILSGTRVIRPNPKKLRIPVVEPKRERFDPILFGPYESRQMMGESQHGKVYVGYDELLKRSVWVVERADNREPTLNRINLARRSRQRWLEGGVSENGQRWDAFEAVQGVPIQTHVGLNVKADWSLYRTFMLDLVDELKEALKDNTLPSQIALPQVWLDKEGHAKLLDRQLVHVVNPSDTTTGLELGSNDRSELPDEERAVRLVQELGDLFDRTSTLPTSAQEFVTELRNKPRNAATLEWAHEQLTKTSKKLGGISWDVRAGILGVTLGLEAVAYLTVAALIFLFCYSVAPIDHRFRFWVGAGLGIILPGVMGAVFRGGPVLDFMGVQVTNLVGKSANRLICGIRAAISWLPSVALVGVFILWLILSEVQMKESKGIETIEGTFGAALANDPGPAVVGSMIVFGISALFIMAGILFAIFSPKRGLLDYLLGSRLLPK